MRIQHYESFAIQKDPYELAAILREIHRLADVDGCERISEFFVQIGLGTFRHHDPPEA